MTHLKVAFEWVGVLWMFAILLSMLGFIGLVLMVIQPWWAKIKLAGGKGLKMLGWWFGLGVGLPSVAMLIASGQPVGSILLIAGLYGVMAIGLHWHGDHTVKAALAELSSPRRELHPTPEEEFGFDANKTPWRFWLVRVARFLFPSVVQLWLDLVRARRKKQNIEKERDEDL
jgi:hypothetical protein